MLGPRALGFSEAAGPHLPLVDGRVGRFIHAPKLLLAVLQKSFFGLRRVLGVEALEFSQNFSFGGPFKGEEQGLGFLWSCAGER